MSARLSYGQVAVTATAQRLSAELGDLSAFTIKAPATNTNPVYVGDASVLTTTGHQLDPGDQIDYERLTQNGQPIYQLKPSDFWVVGSNGDRISWLASQ